MCYMEKAIATVELTSIARGFVVADIMLKSGNVKLLYASPICPGKYLIMIGGFVGAVNNALKAGVDVGSEMIDDFALIPNVHRDVFPAIARATNMSGFSAMGVIETMSAPAAIEGADAAVKAARIHLVEIRLGRGMGAKSIFLFTGDMSDIKTAADAAETVIAEKGLLVDVSILTRPHPDLRDFVF